MHWTDSKSNLSLSDNRLRALLVEDSPDDAEFVLKELTDAGYEVSVLRVVRAQEMQDALHASEFDIVLADYEVPGFGALQALRILKESGQDVPFIIVSGVITDETAVAGMRAGAHDYVLKDNLARLGPAVRRELQEARWRRKAEHELKKSQQSFQALAENIPQMIWVADKNTEFEYLSPKWLKYTGTTAEENANGGWVRALHPEDARHAVQRWREAVRTRGKFETEYRLRRYDGEYRWHFARAVPIEDEGAKTLWFGTTTDIEDQKRTQLSLIKSEKLAAAGRLASTMAHEVNNPLAAALNSLYLALLDNSLSGSTRNHVSLAERELKRVAHITRQTLGFYKESGKPTKVSLRNITENVVELYDSQLSNKDVRLECEYRTDAPVLAVEGEVRQIVANLLSNSIDAVDNHGCIRLRVAGPLTFDGNRPAIRITVSDNGTGIDPKHLARIFEPFFSTKKAYGTGLGLWVAEQLVKKHNGKIRARSKSKTTVFQVFLPLERRKPERLETEIEAIA